MTKEERTRKAVELADGWQLGRNDTLQSPCGYFADLTDQPVLDALDAQLVRQCNEAGYQIVVNFWRPGRMGISINGDDFFGSYYDMPVHQAIVDSGVLE